MSPGRVDTTLALADWLFNFFLVFIFCYLLHTCLTVLNVFCKSTSFRILYIYSLITFTVVYKFSDLNHINKAGPILMLAWLVHNLIGKIIIGPNVDNFFLLCLWPYQTPLTPPYSTLVVPIAGPYPYHEEHSLTPQQLGFHVLSSYLPCYACRLFKWTTWDRLECAPTLLDTWCPWPAPLFQMVPPTVNGISLLHLVSAVECSVALNLQFERSCV